MSHDLNLINANYLSYLSPLSSTKNDNQTRLQPFSFNASINSNQYLYSFNTTDHNFNQNYTHKNVQPIQQVDEALNQNHQALKNLIDMIDNRKTKNSVLGLSFNKNKDYQRTNRFSRKSNEDVKRERKNFIEDLKQVKNKMNQIMRLIDIKIKVNQEQTYNPDILIDFDNLRQKLTVQSAKLDILQRDNSEKVQIYIPKIEDKTNQENEFITTWNNKQNKQSNSNHFAEKIEDQQCLHLKHSFDRLNIDSAQQNNNLQQINPTGIVHSLAHNKLNQTNVVEFFTNYQKQQKKKSGQFFSSKKSSFHHSPQFSQVSYKQRTETQKNLIVQPKFKQQREIRQPQIQQKRYIQRSKSVDNKLISNNSNNQIKIVYTPSNVIHKDSNISNRFGNNQSRFYNPNCFGRPTSNIIFHQNKQTLTNQMPYVNRPSISHFSPPPAHSLSPPLPFRSQQKAIIREWDEESRPDLSFGLSSSVSTHRNGQSTNNLKKSSRNSQKFSFIEHFANNPDARKRRQESIIQNQQVKQSIVQYGFPRIIPRQQNFVIQNPFQKWNKQFNMEKINRRQEMRINDNSMKTIFQTSEHKNKDSIIHQAQFLDSSKSASKPSKQRDIPQMHLMEGGSAYKKKKKGLEVSKRMNQTEYRPQN